MEKTQTYTENITPQNIANVLEYFYKLQETISYQLESIAKQVKAKQHEQQEEQLSTISATAESAACSSYRQPSACTFNTGSLPRGSQTQIIELKIC